MGLPQLTFELKKAADTVAARATQGIAGMIPRDTRALGVHVIYQEGDIPQSLALTAPPISSGSFTRQARRPRGPSYRFRGRTTCTGPENP